jgi:hypothetical protein
LIRVSPEPNVIQVHAMRNLVVAITVAAAPIMAAAPAAAVPVFDCSGPNKAVYRTVCSDPVLRHRGAAIDAKLTRLLRGADPLSAMLLKRDQIWFQQIIGGEDLRPFQGRQDAGYLGATRLRICGLAAPRPRSAVGAMSLPAQPSTRPRATRLPSRCRRA